MKGKGLRSLGTLEVRGEALVSQDPIAFLGYVDPRTGCVCDPDSPICGQSIAGRIFVFPRGIGSTVGPYVLVNLARNGLAPRAIVNRESDQGTVAGASVAGIPLAYAFDDDPLVRITSGQQVTVRLQDGVAELELGG